MFAARRFFSPLLASGTVDRAKGTLSLFLTSDVPADLAGMHLRADVHLSPSRTPEVLTSSVRLLPNPDHT